MRDQLPPETPNLVIIDAVLVADLLLVATFTVVALLAASTGRRQGRAGRWVTAAFGTVSVALAGFTVPEHAGVQLPTLIGKVLIVALLAFPYLLLRFTAAFAPLPRWLELPWAATAGGLAVITLALPVIPEPGADLPGSIFVYVALVLAFWTVTSVLVVRRLWRAGRGQPTVARRRMRLMAGATAVLTVALLAAAPLGEEIGAVGSAVRLGAILSGAIFAVGFNPPASVRHRWRRPEVEALQAGRVAVLRATEVTDVATELLPPTARIVGAGRAELRTPSGAVLGAVGGGDGPDGRAGTATECVVPLPEGNGTLHVWTSPYTPFFGPEEIELLHDMAAVAGLALERCALLQTERDRRVALELVQRDLVAAQEEASRANMAKTEFLSRMSHELRTPLNAILGFGQVLGASDDLDPADQDAVGHIVKAGRHLLDLINEVLNLSRIETGTMQFSLEPVRVADLVAEAVGLVRPLAHARDITVSFRAVSDANAAYVRTDLQRCRQVLLNLLANAVKYHRDGGSVVVTSEAVDGGMVRIAVRDDGPGIDPARHHELFEPFERLGAEGSAVEGTGLGLALSKQLVEQMDGQIGVASALGEGATFWIELPSAEAPPVPVGTIDPPAAGVRTDRRTLLLVEDNLPNLRVVEAMLRARPDVSVIPAMQGSLALELAAQHLPDVIVLDLHLPDLDGRDVLRRLAADPRTKDIPVIVASAEASRSTVRSLMADGALTYLTKPLDMPAFLTAVDAALATPEDPST